MIYAQKYGVSRASRKYNKSRSFIYFWMARYDGTLESLACRSRRPHSHPNQHTPAELKLIRDMRRRNPELGMIETMVPVKKARIQAMSGKSVPCNAPNGDFSRGKTEEKISAKAI
jgi:transposase